MYEIIDNEQLLLLEGVSSDRNELLRQHNNRIALKITGIKDTDIKNP